MAARTGDVKVVVITGASGGIGAALAERLGAEGHKVVIAARREPELDGVRSRSGPDAIAVVTDARRRGDVERLRDRAVEAFGSIDVWVNNAGRGISRSVLELSDEEFDEMMAVNVKSALYAMQAIAPHFMARGQGHIVNISSFLGRVPFVTFRSAYNAAKAALGALTANLRMDLAAQYPGIHVTLVMPGVVLTDFQRNALGGTPRAFPSSSAMKPQSADEVASVIADVIRQPVAEVYTNPALADIARRYYADVGAFEAGWRR